MRLLAVAAIVVISGGVAVTALSLGKTNRLERTVVIPSAFGSYVRKPALEQQVDGKQLRQEVVAKGAGQASHVVYAVYESDSTLTSGGNPEIIFFIGGNLSGVSPAGFITSFTQQFSGARSISAGTLGGTAACVSARPGMPGGVALCAWADSATFGVVASSTMSSTALSAQLRAIRPLVERPVR